MTLKDIFHYHSRNMNNPGVSQTIKPAPVISVLDKLGSPFMAERFTEAEKLVPLDLRHCSNHTYNSLNCDHYVSFKLNDEMNKFYKTPWNSVKLNTNSREFQKRLGLLKIKQQLSLAQVNNDESGKDFVFLFRDFIGHLNLMIDSVTNYSWIPSLIVPFIRLGAYSSTSCQQAFSEVLAILKRISPFQEQDFNFSYHVLTNIWHELTEIMRMPHCINRNRAFEMLKSTIKRTPLSPELIYKVSIMRNIYHDFYTDRQYPFRKMRAELFRCLTKRLTTEYFVDEMHKVRLIQEAMNEIHISYSEESDKHIRSILSESLTYCNLNAYSPSDITIPDLKPYPQPQHKFKFPSYKQHHPNNFRMLHDKVLNPSASRVTKPSRDQDTRSHRNSIVPPPASSLSRLETKLHDQFNVARKNFKNLSSTTALNYPTLKRATDIIQRSPEKLKGQFKKTTFPLRERFFNNKFY